MCILLNNKEGSVQRTVGAYNVIDNRKFYRQRADGL